MRSPGPARRASRRCRSTTTSPTRTALLDGMVDRGVREIDLPAGSGRVAPAMRTRRVGARGAAPAPVGDRADGVPVRARAGDAAPPRRRDRRACGPAASPSPLAGHAYAVLDALRLRLRGPGGAPRRRPRGDRRDDTEMLAAFPAEALPHLRSSPRHVTPPRLRLRRRVRLGPRTGPRRPRAASYGGGLRARLSPVGGPGDQDDDAEQQHPGGKTMLGPLVLAGRDQQHQRRSVPAKATQRGNAATRRPRVLTERVNTAAIRMA